MRTRPLGNSDLNITPLGVGTWAIGGPDGNYNWGPQNDEDSIRAIRRAVEKGINWIDTAPVYGRGHSEEVVGKALKGLTPQPYVFTKCTLVWAQSQERIVTNSLKADSIRLECEESLRRLKVERLDLWQIHWPNPDADIEEGWTEMAKLQREGKVRWIGVSNFSPAQMKRAQAITPVTSLQPPYSAARRDIEKEILPFCGENHIGVIVYSPMQAGILSGRMSRERIQNLPPSDWRRNNDQFKEPLLSRNLALQDSLGKIGEKYGHSAGAAALAWVLRREEVTGAIVGLRHPDQVDSLIAAGEFRLSKEEIEELEQSVSV
jgi:aryl-alcohol dehydrogenase-like predicted oxidoreductase